MQPQRDNSEEKSFNLIVVVIKEFTFKCHLFPTVTLAVKIPYFSIDTARVIYKKKA